MSHEHLGSYRKHFVKLYHKASNEVWINKNRVEGAQAGFELPSSSASRVLGLQVCAITSVVAPTGSRDGGTKERSFLSLLWGISAVLVEDFIGSMCHH